MARSERTQGATEGGGRIGFGWRSAIPYRERPDDALIVLTSSGDERALGELYDRFGGMAYGLALRIVRNPALAEDVVQDAFLSVWRSAAGFDPRRRSARSWVATLTHRRAVDVVDRGGRRREDATSVISSVNVRGSSAPSQ